MPDTKDNKTDQKSDTSSATASHPTATAVAALPATDSTVTYSSSEEMKRNIGIIWLGSTMRTAHVARVRAWKNLNPDYEVTVWTETELQPQIKAQFGLQSEINVATVNYLNLPEAVKTWVTKLINDKTNTESPPNYGAGSDIFRYYLPSGWYFDTDIHPRKLDSIKVDSHTNVHFFGIEEQNWFPIVGAFGLGKDAAFRRLTQQHIEAIKDPEDNVIKLLRSRIGWVRRQATIKITGGIFGYAFGKMTINEKLLWTEKSNLRYLEFKCFFSTVQDSVEAAWLYENVSLSNPKDQIKFWNGSEQDRNFATAALPGLAIHGDDDCMNEQKIHTDPATKNLKNITDSWWQFIPFITLHIPPKTEMFHRAAYDGDLTIVKKLCCPAIINTVDLVTKQSALHLACQEGHLAIVDYLLDQNADMHKEDCNGKTPKMLAITNRRWSIHKKLHAKEQLQEKLATTFKI